MLRVKESEGQDFEPVPAGLEFGRCISVIDLGTQIPVNPQYKPSRQVLIEWELPGVTYEKDGKSIPRKILKFYNMKLGKSKKPSKLRTDLESWRGKPFTEEERDGFDIDKLLGVACALNVVHNKVDDKIYANIASISPPPKNYTVPPQFHPSTKYDIEQGEDKVFEGLHEWIRKKISGCMEWTGEAEPKPSTDETIAEEAQDEVPF